MKYVCIYIYIKRPSSEELLKTKFIKSSPKGTSILLDLIARHENWKLTKNDESDDELLKLGDEETSESEVNYDEDDEWVFETIKSMSTNKNNSSDNTDEDNSMPSKIHGRSKSIFDQMELNESDGTVRETKRKYKENEELTKEAIEKMKLNQNWYNSKGIDTSSMANGKYKDFLNNIPLKANNHNTNDMNNIQNSMENLNISNDDNKKSDENNNGSNNNNSSDHEDNSKTISGNPNTKIVPLELTDFNMNNQKSPLEEDDRSSDGSDEDSDIDEEEDEDNTFEIPNKGVAIKKLTINPAMLDQDARSNIQCYSPVYSIKSYASTNAPTESTVKNSNVQSNNNVSNNTNINNINNNKGKSPLNKSPQIAVVDPINKPQMSHNVKQPSVSSYHSPYTPLLTSNSPSSVPYSANSSPSSPLSNETTTKVIEPIQITSSAEGSKAHSVQTSPFITNIPPQHPLISRNSISAPSTTTSTPTTINVKKNLQSPSVLFQNKNSKLISNAHSHVANGKKKGVFSQYPVLLNTRNSNIRKKTVDNHTTPLKGMIRKLSLNPIDKHNLKENSNIPISPYKTHFYSISCPQNNSYKKNYVSIKELLEKASPPASFDNNNDKTNINIKLRKPGSYTFLGSNNKRPIAVNNLHLYEKDALEKEINEVINETIQCLDAYHALFSDVMIPSYEKNND
ncbi:hypothetical protein H8356DRAFT_49524 [Neocallimastix lanati (nom. inval.)]|nr:hypothetical protein H8356DRAFT_49524 [Neocallimastix sp. JGI-2020a]